MQKIIEYLISQPLPELIAYVIVIGMLISVTFVKFVMRKEVLPDLRGKDGRWQIIELSAVLWWLIFPTVIAVSLLGIDVATGVWSSLDTIYMINVGGKIYINHLLTKSQSNTNVNSSIGEVPNSHSSNSLNGGGDDLSGEGIDTKMP
jgi:hypothetical protein